MAALGSLRWFQLCWYCHRLANEIFLITQARTIIAASLFGGTISFADCVWPLVRQHYVGPLNHATKR